MPYVQGHLQEWSLKATLGHPAQLRASIPAWTGLSISRDIWLYKGPVTDWADPATLHHCCWMPQSTLCPAAAGNQGKNPTMSPLGQGRAFCPVAPTGIVLRASTEGKGHQWPCSPRPFGISSAWKCHTGLCTDLRHPWSPWLLQGASVTKWCSWQPQMCWDGGPRSKFLS